MIKIQPVRISDKFEKKVKRTVTRTIPFYNLDMIISVGYRVNSKQGIIFRKWATSILKRLYD
ncbi:MAG: virulence RhuM family protein [Clostridium sp.]|nr:MAG: virulence RhuM family protein [Clostridium sp.]